MSIGSVPIGRKPQKESTNRPRILFLSIAATARGFILALVGVIAQASHAASPAVEVAMTPGTVAEVVQDVSHVDPITYAVALDAAASHPRYDEADRDNGAPLLFTVTPDGIIIVGRGANEDRLRGRNECLLGQELSAGGVACLNTSSNGTCRA